MVGSCAVHVPSRNDSVVVDWFTCGSRVVPIWFTCGSRLVQMWFSNESVLVHVWFSVGTFLLQVCCRFGSGYVDWFTFGSVLSPDWLMLGCCDV